MSAAEILERIRGLPPEEQRDLVDLIMEEFGDASESIGSELTPEQLAELERRAEQALAHPERGRPFDDVFREIEDRFRSAK